MSKLINRYKLFHDTEPKTVQTVNIDIPADGYLIELGQLLELVYTVSDQNSDKFGHEFIHEFKRPPKLATNVKGNRLYIIGATRVGSWIYD